MVADVSCISVSIIVTIFDNWFIQSVPNSVYVVAVLFRVRYCNQKIGQHWGKLSDINQNLVKVFYVGGYRQH